MARKFTSASSEFIQLSLGAGGSLSGAFTLAALLRKASDGAAYGIMGIGSTATTRRNINFTAGNIIQIRSNNAQTTAAGSILSTDGWVLIVVTKAAGTATPRVHWYKYSTNVWTHTNAAGTLTDSTPDTSSNIGRIGAAGTNFDGDIAVAAAWATAFTDSQVESLANGLNVWWQVQPNGLWVLDQASTSMLLNDLSGGGANQSSITGTTVSTGSVPAFTYGAHITVERTVPDPVTGTIAVTEADDTSSGTGAYGPSGSGSPTEDNDTSTGSGTFTGAAATTPPAATVGSGRPANPQALATHQAWREQLLREDEEILLLV